MSLVGGKGNSVRRTTLVKQALKQPHSQPTEVQLAFFFYSTFSFLVQFLCPCQDEKTWVESLSSYQAVSGPVEKAKPKKMSLIISSKLSRGYMRGSHSAQSAQLWGDFIRKKNGDPFAFFGPETVPRWRALAATFRDNVEPIDIYLNTRWLMRAVSQWRAT